MKEALNTARGCSSTPRSSTRCWQPRTPGDDMAWSCCLPRSRWAEERRRGREPDAAACPPPRVPSCASAALSEYCGEKAFLSWRPSSAQLLRGRSLLGAPLRCTGNRSLPSCESTIGARFGAWTVPNARSILHLETRFLLVGWWDTTAPTGLGADWSRVGQSCSAGLPYGHTARRGSVLAEADRRRSSATWAVRKGCGAASSSRGVE
mmetsp:Transcript_71539/g.201930  ORF Transcript_71539/g.201930 Transcript_71539/m.201930 type:complete len:207 (+) Transcript_71539:89-709(+)